MKQYKLYVLDLDGTVCLGNQVLPGAAEAIATLRERGALIRFLTNSSANTPAQFAAKLNATGVACDESEMLNSGVGAAKFCSKEGYRSAFVVGEPGLIEVLAAHGVRTVNAPHGTVQPQAESTADAAIVGICRSFSYDLLNAVMQQILAGARFIATNPDATYPLEAGRLIPGAGSLVAAVRTCSGKEPKAIGKPEPYLIDLLLEETGVEPRETLVVGDRVETDIDAGRAAGCDVALVMTGVTHEPPPGVPAVADLGGLL
jgi:4-nitrophenyl phosphatase